MCLGGGGLLAGSLLAARALAPACKVYGVEPEAGNDGQRSLRQGAIVSIEVPKTIADGAQTQSLGKIPFEIIRRDAADIFTATDSDLVECMRLLAESPEDRGRADGVPWHGGLRGRAAEFSGQRVGVILSGGNVDAERYGTLLCGSGR